MNYKVGDRVKIQSLAWYNENKDICGGVAVPCHFVLEMSRFCGAVVTIHSVNTDSYSIEEDHGEWSWTDEMIEGLVEEEAGLVDNLSSRWVNEFNLPEGYIFKDENGNVINATKIVLEKKKKEYPKTYEECINILGGAAIIDIITYYYGKQLNALYKLLICRDAYWKIAGEEMRLGKPWEPDFKKDLGKWSIECVRNKIERGFRTSTNCILIFPTEEMRDAFYEAFKKEIEICKELL